MKIMMIPGERNEELILKVHEATVECHADENSDVIDILIDEGQGTSGTQAHG